MNFFAGDESQCLGELFNIVIRVVTPEASNHYRLGKCVFSIGKC